MILLLIVATFNLLVMLFGVKENYTRQLPLINFGRFGTLVYQIGWGSAIDEYAPVEPEKRRIYGHNLGLYLPNGFCVVGVSLSSYSQMFVVLNIEFGLWWDEEHRHYHKGAML